MQSVKIKEYQKGGIEGDSLDDSELSQSVISSAFKNARAKFPKDFGLHSLGEKFNKNRKV